MPTRAFTISKLADAAGVNVETIRYYQRRGILDLPARTAGFRAYDESHLRSLQFLRRAHELGFSLDDAAELHVLSRSRDRKRLREVARSRAADIRERIARLSSIADALDQLAIHCAGTAPGAPCPIVAALTASSDSDDSGAGPTRVRASPVAARRVAACRVAASRVAGSRVAVSRVAGSRVAASRVAGSRVTTPRGAARA